MSVCNPELAISRIEEKAFRFKSIEDIGIVETLSSAISSGFSNVTIYLRLIFKYLSTGQPPFGR